MQDMSGGPFERTRAGGPARALVTRDAGVFIRHHNHLRGVTPDFDAGTRCAQFVHRHAQVRKKPRQIAGFGDKLRRLVAEPAVTTARAITAHPARQGVRHIKAVVEPAREATDFMVTPIVPVKGGQLVEGLKKPGRDPVDGVAFELSKTDVDCRNPRGAQVPFWIETLDKRNRACAGASAFGCRCLSAGWDKDQHLDLHQFQSRGGA